MGVTADASPRVLDTADAGPTAERSSVYTGPSADTSDPIACSGRWRMLLLWRVFLLRRRHVVQRSWYLVFGVGGELRHLRGNLLFGLSAETIMCALERRELERPCSVDAGLRSHGVRRHMSGAYVQMVRKSARGRRWFGRGAQCKEAPLPRYGLVPSRLRLGPV